MTVSTKWVLLLLAFIANVYSVNAQTLKIGFFDSKAIFESIPERIKIQNIINDLQAKYEVEEVKMQEEYQVKVSTFLDEKSKLNASITQARAQEIDQLQQRIFQFRDNAAKDLKKHKKNY